MCCDKTKHIDIKVGSFQASEELQIDWNAVLFGYKKKKRRLILIAGCCWLCLFFMVCQLVWVTLKLK